MCLFPTPSSKAFHSCVSIWIAAIAACASDVRSALINQSCSQNTPRSMWAPPCAQVQIPAGDCRIATGNTQHEPAYCTYQRGCWKHFGLESAGDIIKSPNTTNCECKLKSWLLLPNKNRKWSIMCHKRDDGLWMYTVLVRDRGLWIRFTQCVTLLQWVNLWLEHLYQTALQ